MEVSEWSIPPQECAKRYSSVDKGERCAPSVIKRKEKLEGSLCEYYLLKIFAKYYILANSF